MWTKENIPSLVGKTAIVTGANTGIGFETALALYEAGANVLLACRSMANAEAAITAMHQHKGSGTLEAALLDLSSFDAIRAFADQFRKQHQQLHLLINNAGVMVPPPSFTKEGYELQFGTNFLGHYILTGHLYDMLKATPGARVVTVSSGAYRRGNIDFENLRSEKDYDAMREYSQSKLANLMFAFELQRRIERAGGEVLSIGVQPGANKTELSRHMNPAEFEAAVQRVGALMDPWQGALPSLYAATVEGVQGGEFYEPDQDNGYRGYPAKVTAEPHANDPVVAARLWAFAEKATGLVYP